MKNNGTELVFILDRSGSMAGLETDTIGGFNGMIKKQKEQDGKCYVSTYLFDNFNELIHDRCLLEDVAPMDNNTYTVRGSTALYDAVGEAIEHIESIHKYIRKEDVPQNTIFVITTDGMENSSMKFSGEKVKKMIEAKKEIGWEFLFLGANIDAVTFADSIGIAKDRAVDYHADSMGTACVYSAVSDAVMCMRSCEPLTPHWSEGIKKDFKNRKRR